MASPASNPVIQDITWVRGTTSPFGFIVKKNGTPLIGDDVRFSCTDAKGNLLFRARLNHRISLIDAGTGYYRFDPTAAQTRSLKANKSDGSAQNKYEVEYWIGASQEVYLMGSVFGIGGINDDEVS